ncbi:MAG: 16S rRNA (guanine(527)-N(7))-methyltransferase RsmG [Bacilli bacterium]|nr:16S rRNA (guanine(527)-N(7))-methyltransferase RsmG [Bacilli bacterium]
MDILDFKKILKEKGLELNKSKEEKFLLYYNFLVQENNKYNLTSLVSFDDVFEKHFYDSLSIMFNYNISDLKVLDVGSGAGFPSMPLKIFNESIKLDILDSTSKKMLFIEQLAKRLKLDGVKTIISRAEEYKDKKYDLVLTRGVAKLNVLLEIIADLIKDDAIFVAMKGSSYKDELNESQNAMKILGFILQDIQEVKLPFSNIIHYNLFFKKVNKHDRIYPRSYAKIKAHPL